MDHFSPSPPSIIPGGCRCRLPQLCQNLGYHITVGLPCWELLMFIAPALAC